ncbi:MAG: hypothetical protein HC843_02620 [Sphingomonadales bacterium]|nr:hypothetical protein [Sphingomonadales bacterium]
MRDVKNIFYLVAATSAVLLTQGCAINPNSFPVIVPPPPPLYSRLIIVTAPNWAAVQRAILAMIRFRIERSRALLRRGEILSAALLWDQHKARPSAAHWDKFFIRI